MKLTSEKKIEPIWVIKADPRNVTGRKTMEIKKKKILLVEDEAVVRESLRDWLVEDGYDVEC